MPRLSSKLDSVTTLVWILVAWVVASLAIAWGWSRWFRFLRGDFDE